MVKTCSFISGFWATSIKTAGNKQCSSSETVESLGVD